MPKLDPDAITVSLSARFLLNLALALGDDHCITLQMVADDDNIVRKPIRADGEDGAYGAICPRVRSEAKGGK